MLLVPIPWAQRTWALPFLTALTLSERHHQERAKPHKRLTDWARQMLRLVQRWVPDRPMIVVADSADSVISWLHDLQQRRPIAVITRLRLDAALYKPAPERQARQIGRPRLGGRRLPTLAAQLADPQTTWTWVKVTRWYGEHGREVDLASGTTVWYHTDLPPVTIRWVLIRDPRGTFASQALLSTNVQHPAEDMRTWFVRRWQLEVTSLEVRAHLGVETQRPWSGLAPHPHHPCAAGAVLADHAARARTLERT